MCGISNLEHSSSIAPILVHYFAMNELLIEDTQIGTGAEATAGKMVQVHYTGMFPDGRVFDSSLPRGEAFAFPLGAGHVIQAGTKA